MVPSPTADLDLAPRRNELTRLGYTIVDEAETSFTAVRSVRARDLSNIQWTILMRVKRVDHVDAALVLADRGSLRQDAPPHVPQAKAPLMRQNFRAELVCYLAGTADDEARRLATAEPGYDRTAQRQVGILESDGRVSRTTRSGMMMWATRPKVDWIIQRVLDPASPDPGEPRSGLTSYFRASLLIKVVLMLTSLSLLGCFALSMVAMLVLVVLGVGIGVFLGTG